MHRRRLFAYFQLLRPANLLTAAADILAGYAVVGCPGLKLLAPLCGSSMLLYAGGVALNDVFDAELDAVERPERPIASGLVPKQTALGIGLSLLIGGVALAACVSRWSAAAALGVAVLAVLYDAWGKRQRLWAPFNMAGCRAVNLLLGMSAAAAAVAPHWFLLLIPFAYISAVTLISKGEVHGGSRDVSLTALCVVSTVIASLFALGVSNEFVWWAASPFALYLAWRVLPPFFRAWREPSPESIRKAVLAGVLSLILLDSAIGAGYAGILYGMLVLSLSMVAGSVARLFAVT